MNKENKPFVRGNCPYAFFVIYHRNGTKTVEDRTDGKSWEKAEKRNIAAVGLQFDPIELNYKNEKGEVLRHAMMDHVLKGSQRFEYQFFQFKKKTLRTDGVEAHKEGMFKCLSIGMVIDQVGHCMIMEAYAGGRIRTYYTTLRSLGFVDQLSIDKQNISGTVTQIWEDRISKEGIKEKVLVKIIYDIDNCGLIRNPLTICRACGMDWFIWKDHPQHDCKTAVELKWDQEQRKIAKEVLDKKEN